MYSCVADRGCLTFIPFPEHLSIKRNPNGKRMVWSTEDPMKPSVLLEVLQPGLIALVQIVCVFVLC